MHRRHLVFVQNLVEIADVIRLVQHVHGGVLNDGHRLFITGNIGQKPQSGFAQRPDFLGIIPEKQREVESQTGSPQFGFQFGGQFLHLRLGLAREVHDQNGRISTVFLVFDKKGILALFGVGGGAFQHVVIDQFDGLRLVLQGDDSSTEGFVDGVEVRAQQSLRFGR